MANGCAMRPVSRSHRFIASIVLGGVSLLLVSSPARAQPVDVPATWGGDIWSRPRLTGDWGGLRDQLGKKGVVLDVDVLSTPMDVLSGGRNSGGNFWTALDSTLNIDAGKLGLW